MKAEKGYKKTGVKIDKRENIVRLILDSFKRQTVSEEEDELKRWVDGSQSHKALMDRLQDLNYTREGAHEFQRYDSKADWEKMRARLVEPSRNIRRWVWAGVASVLVLLGSGVAMWYQTSDNEKSELYAETPKVESGRSKAVLFLESGESIQLESGQDTLFREMEGEDFVNDGGKLVYMTGDKKVEWHTLQVPRGGEYTLCLSDGTVIQLNADTRIRYPDRFVNGERRVMLEGEAYFEVKKDSLRPFVVEANDLLVRVLGTSFNLKSYADESQQTTLVEGRVEVVCDGLQVVLSPGEQATCEDDALSVAKVDILPFIAWKTQRVVFDDEFLEDVLKRLARWYDIDVIIEDASTRKIRFTGNLPKYERIEKVLNMLQMTTRVKFELEGRNLIVKKE